MPNGVGKPTSYKGLGGAQGRNRTTDTAIFSRMLYQLSYLGPAGWHGTGATGEGDRSSRNRPACPPTAPALRPFCSERCRQVDLGRWLAGDYAIPTGPDPDGGEPDQG